MRMTEVSAKWSLMASTADDRVEPEADPLPYTGFIAVTTKLGIGTASFPPDSNFEIAAAMSALIALRTVSDCWSIIIGVRTLNCRNSSQKPSAESEWKTEGTGMISTSEKPAATTDARHVSWSEKENASGDGGTFVMSACFMMAPNTQVKSGDSFGCDHWLKA